MRATSTRRRQVAGLIAAALLTGGHAAFAQSTVAVPPGWHVRHVKVVGDRGPLRTGLAGSRSLTVRKPFPSPIVETFSEGGIVYGNVAAFVPEPKIESGVQFPYGLDGIGGYGSDIGLGTSNDSDIYDRGALDQRQAVRLGNE